MSDFRDSSDRNVLYWKALRDALGRMRQEDNTAAQAPDAEPAPPDDARRAEGLRELRSVRLELEAVLEEQAALMQKLDGMSDAGVLLDGRIEALHFMLQSQTEANAGLRKYLDELTALSGSAAAGSGDSPEEAPSPAGTDDSAQAEAAPEVEMTGAPAAPEEARKPAEQEFAWREAAAAIAAGQYDGDRDRLLDVLEAAIAAADRENVPDAERGPLKAAQEHFTALLAHAPAGAETAGGQPVKEAAAPEAVRSAEPETAEQTPEEESAEHFAESGPRRIPVAHSGGEQTVPLRRADTHNEPGTANLPDWMADIVGIAAGRLDTGSSLTDVQTQSEILRRAIDRARQEGREQEFRPWFDQASGHINTLLRGAAARGGGSAWDAEDDPEYMRLVDKVNAGEYDGRVEDIFPIINVALQEARRQGRDTQYRARIQKAADRLSKLLSASDAAADARVQAEHEHAAPEAEQPVRDAAPQREESAEPAPEEAGEPELPDYMQDVQKVLDGFYDEDPYGAQSVVRSAAEAAAEDGRGSEFEDMLDEASDRVDMLLGGREERQPASEGELPPYMQAVQGVLEGAYDSDPRAMLTIVRRAAQLAEQEGRQEEYGDMIRAASERVTDIMRAGQHDDAETYDAGGGEERPQEEELPEYMEPVRDVLQGRYDSDPGAMLVAIRRAAQLAAQEGRQEEFADMLQSASDRFAMLMHRAGYGQRDAGSADWAAALQDVVRGAYDGDPERMESVVRWAARRAEESGQLGRFRGLIEQAMRRLEAVSSRRGPFWGAF